MTLFGIAWLIVIAGCFIKKDIKYMLFITLLSMTFQCSNVIYLGGAGIGPGIITSLLFVIKVFIHEGGRIRYYKKDKILFFLLLFMVFTVILSSVLNQVFGLKIIYILQLIGYVLCFFCIHFVKYQLCSEDIYKILRAIIVFISLLGVIQFFTTIEILPLRKLLELLIYNDPSTDVVFHKFNYDRMMSTFMEPSYYAGFVVGAFYYLLSMKEKWKENAWILALLMIEIILTKSSTAYGAFFVVGIIFIIFAKNLNIKWKFIIIGIAIIGFLVVYFGFYNLLDAVIFSKDSTGSFSTRTRMNNEAFRAFESSKWYGLGYKNYRGSSIVYSLLAQLGVMGLTAYALFNLKIFAPLLNRQKNSNFDISLSNGLRFAVFSAVICQIIACPDLDLCTYWFWLYCIGMVRND